MPNKSLYELKQAVMKAKKVFVWTVYGTTPEGTQLGGYIETYKAQMQKLFSMHAFQPGTTANFRVDPQTGFLFVDPFSLDQAA